MSTAPPIDHDRSRWLPIGLLVLLCLLTIVCFAPDFPYFGQDSGWPLALNQAVADHAVFGQDIIFNLGPWASVYTGQYHPATAAMMYAGSAIVAAAFSGGLIALTAGWTRWLALLAPLLAATVGLRDPVFIALPLLLLSLAATLGTAGSAIPRLPEKVVALLLLCVAAALLSFVKSTFGTQAIIMMTLALAALASARKWRLACGALSTYVAALAVFWVISGQRLADLPRFFGMIPLLISGYTEGLAKSGAPTDIAAYLIAAAALLLGLLLARRRPMSASFGLLFLGTAFTLFVAFKSGFVRHDEHALIAAGTLALLPLTVAGALERRALLPVTAAGLGALAFITHHYPGYEWPSYGRAQGRLASVASDAWRDVADPGWARRQFDFSMSRIKAAFPLPAVPEPSDIYSSGQAILLANGLQWSPRPVLQSVTVTSPGAAAADLAHLEGENGHPPVQNVFFALEDEDNRLPTLQDGTSWPALLSEFEAVGYDRGEQIAFLRRKPGAKAAAPTELPLLRGAAALGHEVALPDLPTGLGWITLDIRPTLLGRLVNFLFRPPALFISLRYGDGHMVRYRLLSDLARTGFLLTPPVSDTEGMLRLLLPERTAPEHKPSALVVSGESGTRLLWQAGYAVDLRSIDIPLQPAVQSLLVLAPRPAQAEDESRTSPADACRLDAVAGQVGSRTPLGVSGDTEVDGWIVASITASDPPSRFTLLFTDATGHAWQVDAPRNYRPDIAGYFNNQRLVRSGFKVKVDLSGLQGFYAMTMQADEGTRRWRCKLEQPLRVDAPK